MKLIKIKLNKLNNIIKKYKSLILSGILLSFKIKSKASNIILCLITLIGCLVNFGNDHCNKKICI